MRRRRRKCRHCKELFLPCRSVGDRQTHCSKTECQRARKAANNRAFAERNPDYWQGSYNVARTRRWRGEHPGYWRNEKRNGGPGRPGIGRRVPRDGVALQAALLSEAVDTQLLPLRQKLNALQAVSEWHVAVVQGLASHLTGCALQAELGPVLNAWYDRGSRLGGGASPPCTSPQPKE